VRKVTAWLLGHDWAIQALAAGSLALVYWLSTRFGRARGVPDPKDLPPMSTDWRQSKDRWKR
jgi:hypothetical protein